MNNEIKMSVSSMTRVGDKKAVYCRSGNRSKQAAKKLISLGYTNVIEIGGITDWKGEIVK